MPFDFGIKDIIDILLVALMLYYVYRLMKESRSLSVFGGIMVFVLVWLLVSQIFEMRLMGSILDKLVSVGVIGLVVLFQEEIRKFLYSLGGSQRFRSIAHFFRLRHHKDEVVEDKETIMPIVMACMNMARQKVGALIVMERSVVLDDVVETGDRIDARINQRLIENIFFKNSPLHDGAMIISKKRIKAAGCILPVSHDLHIPIRRSWDCVTVPRWVFRRRAMPSPSSFPRKQVASASPFTAISACASRQRNWKRFWQRK